MNMKDDLSFTCCLPWTFVASSKCSQLKSFLEVLLWQMFIWTGSPLSYSWGRSNCYSDRLHDFSVTTPRCYKDVYVNSFFSCTARLWNFLPIESFQNGAKMEPWGNPASTGYSCEDFPSRTTQSHLLLRKEEIMRNNWPEIP